MKSTRAVSIAAVFPEPPNFTMLSPFAAKELKVILSPAVWGALAMVLLLSMQDSPVRGLVSGFLYPLICSAIGALAFGHDYMYRTIGQASALPVSRQQIWRTRMTLATAAMLPIAVLYFAMVERIFIWALFAPGTVKFSVEWPVQFLLSLVTIIPPALAGLCLAPWLTLISRRPLFGAVMSLSVPFVVQQIVLSLGQRIGLATSLAWAALFWSVYLTIFVVGAFLGWRKFMTLEVIDGAISARAAKTTRSGARQRVRRSSVTWQLFKKEIMLQKLSLGLAAVTMSVTLFLNKDQTALWTLVYPMALVVVIGSISCAEERQLGTAEWQTLLPVAAWKQWLIKFLTTFGLATVFGVAFPLLLVFYKTDELRHLDDTDVKRAATVFAACLFMFTVITMYVSSLCSSGLKAVMTAVWVNVLGAYLVMQLFAGYLQFLWSEDALGETWLEHDGVVQPNVNHSPLDQMPGGEWWLRWQFAPFLISISGLIGLAMVFAMRNQRSAERGAYRTLRQVAAFAGFQAVAMLGTYIFWNWYTWLR